MTAYQRPALGNLPQTTHALANVGTGFNSPVHGSQQTFRTLLDATARPGTVRSIPALALETLQPPPPLTTGLAAVLLTLLDADTTVHLAHTYAEPAVSSFLRFHTGARQASPEDASFVVAPAARADSVLWDLLNPGSDEAPHESATLILDVPLLFDKRRDAQAAVHQLRIRGPGIRGEAGLWVGGFQSADVAEALWRARQAQEARFPRGVDLILVSGNTLAALPRSTHICIKEY